MVDDKKPKMPPPLPGGKLPARPAAGPVARPPLPSAGGVAKPFIAPASLRPVAPAPAMPGRPAAAAPSNASSSELDEMRRQMETQINTLNQQLQEEKEKLLLQTVRAKEEEAMAAKVEDSLKDIQDRLRREKREQELQEALNKAEAQVKETEQRMAAERQTWVETLRTQMGQRDSQDRELENGFELKLKELERRWHEEKLGWSQALRSREEELARLRKELESAVAAERTEAEKRISQIESEKESLKRELKELAGVRQEEKEIINDKLESRDKEFLSLKAQQAMVVTQMRQEKEKGEQMRQLLEKMRAEKMNIAGQVEAKEKEYFLLKTQFALYQTRSKSEQEKILKELVIYKEQMQKDRQQWEVGLKTKDNEIAMLQQSFKTRENELLQQVNKKEMETTALNARHEDRLKAREAELKSMLERKDMDSQNMVRAAEERFMVREQDFSRALTQKDRDIRALELQWSEKLQSKDRELSAAHEQARNLNMKLMQSEHAATELSTRVSAGLQELSNERAKTAQKESEKLLLTERLEQAKREFAEKLLLEQEKLQNQLSLAKDEHAKRLADKDVALRNLEQEKQSLIVDLGRMRTDLETVQREAARLRDAVSAEREQSNGRLRELTALQNQITLLKDEHAKRLADKDAALRSQELGKQALAADLDRVHSENETLQQETARLREQSNAQLREMTALQNRIDEGRASMDERIEREQEKAQNQLALAKEEYRNAVIAKEADLRAAEQEKQNMLREIARVQSAVDGADKEILRLRNELMMKEKDFNVELSRRDMARSAEVDTLQAKIAPLENRLAQFQKETEQIIAQYRDSWRRKEESFLSDIKIKEEAINTLKNELVVLRSGRERMAQEKQELETRAHRAQMEKKEEIAALVSDKEKELARVKAEQARSEEQMKKELAEEFHEKLLELENERAQVRTEIQHLRAALQEELKRTESQFGQERAEWQQRVSSREAELTTLRVQKDELSAQIAGFNTRLSETRQQATALDGHYEELENKLIEKSTEVMQLKEQIAALIGRQAQPEAGTETAHTEDLPPEQSDGLKSQIGRFWKNLNEPVIEIPMKKKNDTLNS